MSIEQIAIIIIIVIILILIWNLSTECMVESINKSYISGFTSGFTSTDKSATTSGFESPVATNDLERQIIEQSNQSKFEPKMLPIDICQSIAKEYNYEYYAMLENDVSDIPNTSNRKMCYMLDKMPNIDGLTNESFLTTNVKNESFSGKSSTAGNHSCTKLSDGKTQVCLRGLSR